MENRPAPLRSRRVCRFCLTESEPLSFIYERDHSKPFQVPLTLQIMSCVAIEVYAADGMPQMICSSCRWNLDRSYKFKIQCKKADEALRAYPVSGVLPRPFPPLPTNPSEAGSKRTTEQRSPNESAKKPRVEEGERERRDQRERERERQSEKQENTDRDIYEDDQDGGSDGENDNQTKKDTRKLEPGEIRVHACDQCDRTFPLRQALQLHMQTAHRDRNYKCTECDKHFFTKYDLTKHVATHSEEKPFTCQICNKRFARVSLLQRHEKIHRDELRYGCQHCDREFFTTDELEKHEATVHKAVKPYQCNICNKRFTYRQGLERHELLHSDDKSFVCEYCKEAFRSSTKLARHLTTHAGHRPYLCKLCPRSFLLSHHLTRHMRTHSVEKPHVCEECGKAFKRKESLEVHQLTHAKRGMGLTCEICQESCRNRADYVTHIKQHIEAGEKMGPDGLRPEVRKEKIDSESEEEEEEEDDTDGDDDYEPPAYVAKKIPKNEPPESDDEEVGKSDRKERVVYVRNKDGNVIKKTIKTLMPIQRREIQETKGRSTPSSSQSSAKHGSVKSENRSVSSDNESTPKLRSQHRDDDTEAEVQKIVASVFKEHKIPLKHQNIPQEQSKDSPSSVSQIQTRSQQAAPATAANQSSNGANSATAKDDTQKSEAATPKSVNTVKVIKRIVVRKPAGSSEGVQALASSIKECESPATPGSGTKVTKRVIVRRIIRHGDTTREVILNPDGTMLDPAELAKLPTRNVIKRVVVKKSKDKAQSQGDQSILKAGTSESKIDSPKFELKTSQSATSTSQIDVKPSSPSQKQAEGTKGGQKGCETPVTSTEGNEENPESTKEKLEKLEKRVEQQRLKIKELEARKHQEIESVEDMLPERQDESEEEQELPLKRVFVKRKQSVYDEEKEYDSDEKEPVTVKKELQSTEFIPTREAPKRDYKKPVVTSTSKVYGNKKIILIKSEEPAPHIDDALMTRELSNILDSTETVVKMQDHVLSNLSEISALDENTVIKTEAEAVSVEEPMEEDTSNVQEQTKTVQDKSREALLEDLQAGDKSEDEVILTQDENDDTEEVELVGNAGAVDESQPDSSLSLEDQDIPEQTENFVGTESGKSESIAEVDDSVIELSNDTINLNEANETQDSIEDKLSQLDS